MLARVVILTLLVSTASAALAMSYAFRVSVSGRLDAPVMFEFYSDSTTRVKTDIESFGVAVRTPDHEWKPVWSIYEGRRVAQPIQYGLTPPGFSTRTAPQRLHAGRVYSAFASDGRGGHGSMYFRFRKDGAITFPDSPD
jgi:hypothetical protein